MSGRSLCYPVWCLDDRNFSSLFGTITPTQALETWDKASWLKEKVPYKLWQIWHACWLVYDRETKAQFSDYPKMYFVITPGLAQCFSIFKKRLTNGKHVLTSISFSKVLKGRDRISWRTVLQRHDLSLTTAEISPEPFLQHKPWKKYVIMLIFCASLQQMSFKSSILCTQFLVQTEEIKTLP